MKNNWIRLCFALALILCGIGLLAMGAETPLAVADTSTTAEDVPVTIAVLSNDTGLADIPITVSISTAPTDGTATINAGNTITYTPNTDFNGTDSFSYVVQDTDGDTSEALVTVTIGSVNDAPTAEDDFVITPEDTPVSLTLEVSDPDVDPYYPEGHPLQFAIVSGPAHGTISGDLSDVTYEIPHTASVSLTYTPAAGYVGSDTIIYSVTDLFGESTTAMLSIDVGESLDIGYLSGRWTGFITFESQTFSITALRSTLTTVYRLGSFRIQGDTTWLDDSLSTVVLTASFPLGEMSIRSSLSFDANTANLFNYWQTVTQFDLFEISLANTFYLSDIQTSSYNRVVARWEVADISFSSTTTFAGCDFSFTSEVVTARWNWALCDIDLDARLNIDCEGFEQVSLTMRDIPILSQELFGFGIYLQSITSFTTTSKEVEATIICKSDWIDCFKVLCELIGDGMSIDGISLYGVQFQTALPGGIEVRSDTSLVDAKNSSITGYSDYFERLRIWGPAESCCGSPGRWEIRTYFQSTHTTLFDWGMTTVALDIVITDSIRFHTGLSIRSTEPTWEWTGGWDIRW